MYYYYYLKIQIPPPLSPLFTSNFAPPSLFLCRYCLRLCSLYTPPAFPTAATAASGAKGPAVDGQADPGRGVAREEEAAALGETEKAGARGGEHSAVLPGVAYGSDSLPLRMRGVEEELLEKRLLRLEKQTKQELEMSIALRWIAWPSLA